MSSRLFAAAMIWVSILMASSVTHALTMKQFSSLCQSHSSECSELPVIQAYIGGALDLLAVLDERTDYLAQLYCNDPADLFNVADIVRFMEKQSEQYISDNAMLVLVRYFEENGGCK